MRMNQILSSALMTLVVLFGAEGAASAQLGGLLGKAKSLVKEKDNAQKEAPAQSQARATSQAQEKVLAKLGPGEPGVVTITQRKTGKVLGTYDRAACKLTTSSGATFIFQEDGTVADASGAKVGSIDGQTFTTPRGEQLRCDEIGIIFVDNTNVGAVSNPKMAILGDGSFIDVSDKMNGVVLGYFLFGILQSNEQLLATKKGYQEATMTENPTDEEWRAQMNAEIDKRHGGSGSSSSGQAVEMSLRKGGSIVGRILPDGTVYVGGSIVGKIDADNNIYVGGHIEGGLRDNGEVLKNGHVVGSIDSEGNVRINGSIIGGISDQGDVYKGGSIVGRVEPLADLKRAALFYFFNFWYSI